MVKEAWMSARRQTAAAPSIEAAAAESTPPLAPSDKRQRTSQPTRAPTLHPAVSGSRASICYSCVLSVAVCVLLCDSDMCCPQLHILSVVVWLCPRTAAQRTGCGRDA